MRPVRYGWWRFWRACVRAAVSSVTTWSKNMRSTLRLGGSRGKQITRICINGFVLKQSKCAALKEHLDQTVTPVLEDLTDLAMETVNVTVMGRGEEPANALVTVDMKGSFAWTVLRDISVRREMTPSRCAKSVTLLARPALEPLIRTARTAEMAGKMMRKKHALTLTSAPKTHLHAKTGNTALTRMARIPAMCVTADVQAVKGQDLGIAWPVLKATRTKRASAQMWTSAGCLTQCVRRNTRSVSTQTAAIGVGAQEASRSKMECVFSKHNQRTVRKYLLRILRTPTQKTF
ncbi:cysteine-rich with EGF-like domain protein 2 precursor [Ictalurus punctatus]|uniref:Cysteine-rich with egf-like domain protein 2 n=1 Tax=Ictalurus punctatus TaxID=7998 RepID=E3TEY4_ICTPU|nr:cysteine-rich with EGF-like domain protein 2 precursor [Ictalurus punctatus]ADO28870.1 cysteine-rich with egf-like domain protein 2 [Ictalurus punctatus]